MPEFKVGEAVITEEPRVQVENVLDPATYVFQLIVTVDGVASKPMERTVIVRETELRPQAATEQPAPKPRKRTPKIKVGGQDSGQGGSQ